MKEYSPEEIKEISLKSDVSTFNLFHFSKGYYLSNSMFLHRSFPQERRSSRTMGTTYVFDENLDEKGLEYLSSFGLGKKFGETLTEHYENSGHYRLAPDNYYFLQRK